MAAEALSKSATVAASPLAIADLLPAPASRP
jgi:hypothetical protein